MYSYIYKYTLRSGATCIQSGVAKNCDDLFKTACSNVKHSLINFEVLHSEKLNDYTDNEKETE